LPVEFFADVIGNNAEPVEIIKERAHFRELQPVVGMGHGEKKIFVKAYVRVDSIKGPLQTLHNALFRIVFPAKKLIQFD
jgi:hypothetical protein